MGLALTLALYGFAARAQDGEDPTQQVEVSSASESESGEASASDKTVDDSVSAEASESETPSEGDGVTEPEEPAKPSEAGATSEGEAIVESGDAAEADKVGDIDETAPSGESLAVDAAPPSVEEPIAADTTTTRTPPTSPSIPPRHTGEVRAPAFPKERGWGLRPTTALRAGDLLGFGSLIDPSFADDSLVGTDDRRHSQLTVDGHLVAYGELPSLWDDLSFELAFVARFGGPSPGTSRPAYLLQDDGSYLKATWAPLAMSGGPVAAFTLFPLSSDRLRLGSLEDLSWGGTRTLPVTNELTPAVRVGVEWLGAYAFVAGKAAAWAHQGDVRPFGSVLGGAGVDLFDLVALETGGGWFSRGTTSNPGVSGEPIPAYGVSSRVALHWGRSAVLAPDYRTLQRDLALVDLASVGARLPAEAETSALLALEHSFIGERGQWSDDLHEMKHSGGQAIALSARLRWSRLTFAVDGVAKEASWSRAATFDSRPLYGASVATEPELLAGGSVGLDLGVARGAVVGSVALPRTVSAEHRIIEGAAPSEVVVVRPDGQVSILPPGEARGIYGTLGGVVLVDLGSTLTVGGTLSTEIDGNRTRITDGAGGGATRERVTTWGMPLRVEAYGALLAQMRF